MAASSLRLTLLALACSACAHADERAADVAVPRAIRVERAARTGVPSTSERFDAGMSEHFGFVAAARNGVVRGDLAAAQDALTQLD